MIVTITAWRVDRLLVRSTRTKCRELQRAGWQNRDFCPGFRLQVVDSW
jgi:hypothetical protein